MTIITTWFRMEDMMNKRETPPGLKISDFEDKSLLIVDDDDPLRIRLARAMEKKGFQVKDAKKSKGCVMFLIINI